VRRVANQRDYEQIYQMMTGNEQWAVKVLERDMKENQTDHLNEIWNSLLPETQVDEGKMAAAVIDLQGRFNLNNLKIKDDPWYALFQRLLRVLELDEALADAVIDWVDADQDVSGNSGAEDAEYLSANPPYRAANRGFGSVGELLWVAGFDGEIVDKLAPFVAALPADAVKINVNTASATLLRALSSEVLSESSAETLVARRGEEGYKDLNEFLTATELAGQGDVITPLIALSSRYFEVAGRAQYGRLDGAIYSVLEKSISTQQVKVVHRRWGFS
jgi:general secretion pathway protein K